MIARTHIGVVGAALAAVIALFAMTPSQSGAVETVTLHTSFTPDRLGANTTIGFGFKIVDSSGGVPPALSNVGLKLPVGINYLTTTLGLAICQPEALLKSGLAGCSPNSRLGFGSAFVEVPFGSTTGREIPHIDALMGPPHDGNIVVLFYADGTAPVSAQLVLQSELIEGSAARGGALNIGVPPIPSVPGGPTVSIISVQTTIGPEHLTYYTHRHGRRIAFHPKGVSVPEHCPRGGFRFSATFAFIDGSSATANSTVPCPRGH